MGNTRTYRVREYGNILQKRNRIKCGWVGHILLRDCVVKHVVEGKREGRMWVTGRR